MPSEYALLFSSTIIEVFVLLFVGYEVVAGEVRHRRNAVTGDQLNNLLARPRISMRVGLFIVLVSGAIWAATIIAYQLLSNAPSALSTTTIYYVGLGLVVLAILLCAVLWKINRRRRPRPMPAAIVREGSSSVGDTTKAIAPPMSAYDRERRKQEIDDLVQSIVAGKTLQSVNHARRFAWLLHSAIYTGRSIATLGNEIIELQNSLIEADNERLTITRRYPESPDISDLVECKDWSESRGENPREMDLLRGLHSYVQDHRTGGNIPDDALNNLPTWTFFRDTVKVAEAKGVAATIC